jgi:hypothetical protein
LLKLRILLVDLWALKNLRRMLLLDDWLLRRRAGIPSEAEHVLQTLRLCERVLGLLGGRTSLRAHLSFDLLKTHHL